MRYFVKKNSIVRQIWGEGDTVLLIFAGAAAEFALNKAVDWLYFTGRLPSDPLGRMFTTVAYAREIVFSEEKKAHKSIDNITAIHTAVEKARNSKIPQWAYRDVLFMLIDYSIRAHEVFHNKLSPDEKEEVYNVFFRVGARMGIQDLPESYHPWEISRKEHLLADLEYSPYSRDLFRQYKNHLGGMRYYLLTEAQKLVIPAEVRNLLEYSRFSLLRPWIKIYTLFKGSGAEWRLKTAILPREYLARVKDLDVA